MLVRDLMTAPPRAVPPTTPVSALKRIFENHGIHHVVVMDDGQVVGIVTPRDVDLVELGAGADTDISLGRLSDHVRTARDAMRGWPVCVGADQPLSRAAELLSTGQFHALPVLDDDDALVGVVTTTDLVGYLRLLLERAAPE